MITTARPLPNSPGFADPANQKPSHPLSKPAEQARCVGLVEEPTWRAACLHLDPNTSFSNDNLWRNLGCLMNNIEVWSGPPYLLVPVDGMP